MSHPDQDPRNEIVGQWLPLTEYSVKSGVSLSTIRRKIKSQSIRFKLEKGKYLIYFEGSDPNLKGMQSSSAMPSEKPTTHHINIQIDEMVRTQQARIQQLEQEKEELAFLVTALEQKYGVRY